MTFNDAPDDVPDSEIQFTKHWEAWARTSKDYLKQNDKLFERSVHFADIIEGDADSLTGYSHIRGDRGFVFLINPGPVEQVGELTLSLEAPKSTRFVVNEVYPGGMTLRGPADGAYPHGSQLRMTVPGKQVRILWVAQTRPLLANITSNLKTSAWRNRDVTSATGAFYPPLLIQPRLVQVLSFRKGTINTSPM